MTFLKDKILKTGEKHALIRPPPLKGLILILIVFTAALQPLFSACATFTPYEFEVIPLDQFPDFIVSGGPDISPASEVNTVPDANILGLTDDIKLVLDESVRKISDRKKRMIALIEIAMNNVRLDLSEDAYGAKTAAETFETGTGNCLSFSNLLVAMARYVGLDAGFEEIPTPPNWIKNGEVLFFTRHIGVRVELPGSPGYNSTIIDIRSGERLMRWYDNKVKYLLIPFLQGQSSNMFNMFSTRSISDNRAFSQYYNNIGSMHLAEGNPSEAFRYFVKAIKLDPELSFLWSNLGSVYNRNNQGDVAETVFLNALAINRERDKLSSMTIMGNLARLYSRQGREEEAEIYEEQVRRFRDRNPYYHYSLGETAFNEEEYGQAIEHFLTAIDKKEDESQFYYVLALAYQQLGDIGEADKSMDKAISYAWDNGIKDYYKQFRETLSENPAPKD